jgi:hypothetical protein
VTTIRRLEPAAATGKTREIFDAVLARGLRLGAERALTK